MVNENSRRFYESHLEFSRTRVRRYAAEHPDWVKQNNHNYYHTNRETERARNRQWELELKISLHTILGSKCGCCAVPDTDYSLHVDHIFNDGYDDRMIFKKSNRKMFQMYIKYPDYARERLQLLCITCNWLKKPEPKDIKYLRLKEKMFALLGSVCIKCECVDRHILQFDHINGNGNVELARFNGRASMWRYYLKHPEEAKAKLQTLCVDCNWAKRHQEDLKLK